MIIIITTITHKITVTAQLAAELAGVLPISRQLKHVWLHPICKPQRHSRFLHPLSDWSAVIRAYSNKKYSKNCNLTWLMAGATVAVSIIQNHMCLLACETLTFVAKCVMSLVLLVHATLFFFHLVYGLSWPPSPTHSPPPPPPILQLMQPSLARLLQPTETVAGTPECISECQVWQSQPSSASLMDTGFNLRGGETGNMCVGVCGQA